MKMSDVEKFKEWHSERMGHPLGVILGINAVSELELEVKRLKVDREGLMQVGYDANSSLRSDNDRMAEEIAELKSHLENLVTESIALAQFKNDTLRGNIRSTDLDEPEWHDYQTIGEAGAYLAKLNQEGEE